MTGGSDGNERLTGRVAAILLVLLAAEGATLIAIRQLLLPHVFLGFLLIPPVALKLASVAWRMTSYYRQRPDYARRGPPAWPLRYVVGPVAVLSTFSLFATGVAIVLSGRRGMLVGLHKASFIVWFGAMSIHVLAHIAKVPGLLRDRLPGSGLRLALVAGVLVAGIVLAVATIPVADHWQDRATAFVGVDRS